MKSVTDWNSIESVSQLAKEQEASLGGMNPQLAETLTQLADLHFINQDYVNAETLYWRVLTIRQKSLGEWHPDTGATLIDLAELYEIQDRYAEAQRFYKWATSVKKSSMLKAHSDSLDATVTMQVEPKLPKISELNAACKKCGRRMLDSVVCMYCTQGGFDTKNHLKSSHDKRMAAAAGPVNMLTSQDGSERYKLDEPIITIGRHPSNNIVFSEDKNISRQHAKLQFTGGEFVITDTHSANGTWVNAQKLSGPTKLRQGDIINLGNKVLVCGYTQE